VAPVPADGDTPGTVPDSAIAGLPALIGQRVRVAGTVSLVDGPLATIGDGTGQVVVRAPAPHDSREVAIHPRAGHNALGYVSHTDGGGLEIVVTDLADLTRAPALLAEASAAETPAALAIPDPSFRSDPPPAVSEAADGAPLLVGLFAGLMAGGAVASGGVLAVLGRRRRVAASDLRLDRSGPGAAPETGGTAHPDA
jgi:hypothetical protein